MKYSKGSDYVSIFNPQKRTGGFMDQIRCDEPDYLIWKWHPTGVNQGAGNRENAIRLGSSLRVKDGEVAVFVYHQKNGTYQDYIEGPFDKIIKTANLPVLASIVGLAYEGGTPFQAEIYYINLARIVQTRFAVPFFDVYDPRFSDFGVPVAVRGTISFRIKDYREFIKLHRLNTFDLNSFQNQIRDTVCRYVKDRVANAPAANNIPVVQLESRVAQLNDTIEYDLSERLKEDFGVFVSGIDIGAIEIDKTSEGYQRLMSVTRDVTAAKIGAETKDYTERLRIQREEGQYAMHKQTQSANIGAFQVEKQTEVGVAGAEALGHMGENGAGSVNMSDSNGGTGFNPAAMMTSMAVGGAVGQKMAETMNSAMSGSNFQPSAAPPPIPTAAYYVAVNGKAEGPYNVEALRLMKMNRQINQDTLVWKQGMENWEKAGCVEELQSLFIDTPPIPNQ